MQQSRRARHLHVDLDEPEVPPIEAPAGSQIQSPRAVNPNSRRILNHLTSSRTLVDSAEFGTNGSGRVRVFRTAQHAFWVVRDRKPNGRRIPQVELAVEFSTTAAGDYYPVGYLNDPPRAPNFEDGSISSEALSPDKQQQLARNMDDWLPDVERTIGSPPVAQAG